MTTDPPRSGLHPLSQLKAGPTTSSFNSTATPTSPTARPTSQLSHRPQLSKNPSRDEQANATSEKATIALIRRVLCPQSGGYSGPASCLPEELLPPLTSSNDVDRQLYALIAIIIKEFVSSWYSKVTSDQNLINEALQVIAHCTRALEQRLRDTDVAQLVLDELPALVETHITSYRLAKEQSNLSGFSPSSREIYHALNPHPALSPVPDPSDAQTVAQQRENETIYRQLLVHGVLIILLPTEDLENSCLRTLVGDILADLVLGNEVSGKVCKGWFLWESMTKALDILSSRDPGNGSSEAATEPSHTSRLQIFGLISPTEGQNGGHSSSKPQSSVSYWIWHILQYGYLVCVTLWFLVVGLFRVATTPGVTVTSTSSFQADISSKIPATCFPIGKRPVLDYRLYGMLSQLLDIPRRMPWLGGLLALFQYLILAGPGKLGDSGSVLDRFLHEAIEDYVLTPTLLPNLLLASREALFPQNARPKPVATVNRTGGATLHTSVQQQQQSLSTESRPVAEITGVSTARSNASTPIIGDMPFPLSPGRHPSALEVAAIRRQCAIALLSLIPRPIARHVLGISASRSGNSPADFLEKLESSSKQNLESLESSSAATSDLPSPAPGLTFTNKDTGEEDSEKGDEEEALLLKTVENDILDLFADDYCNKHLLYSILESVLAKILPELSGRSVIELMEDRGVSLVPG